jgi:para-aminobenzoate synthetase component I
MQEKSNSIGVFNSLNAVSGDMLDMSTFIQNANELGAANTSFVFIIDYKAQQAKIQLLETEEQASLYFRIGSHTNFPFAKVPKQKVLLQASPISFEKYQLGFDKIQEYLHRGDSFLVNYTQATPIELNLRLQEIFAYTKAKYQLYTSFENEEIVAFSPETFVKIDNNVLSTFPMKGTISADVPNAKDDILNDAKELAEHTTIVDLLRNDLSKVSEKVWVERFRYIENIETHKGNLLQVSSEIKANMPEQWNENLGDILANLLPAGSICGAPKPETLRIINEVENYDRGFYTGIVGIYKEKSLDCGVLIRFIEKNKKGTFFKSGGGITTRSKAEDEYQEMIEKIYIPLAK